MSAAPSTSTFAAKPVPSIKGLGDKVLRYFREFLQTDFKRQAAPRRKIHLKTKEGYRCAVDLRKYPSFFKDAWQLAAKPPQEMRLTIGHAKYKAQISPVLRNLIQQFVAQLSEQEFVDMRAGAVRSAVEMRVKGSDNPEQYVESVSNKFAELMAARIVHPLLTLLEGPFKEAAYSPEDSIFEVEADLTEALCAGACEHMVAAINTLLLSGNAQSLVEVLDEFFTLPAAQAQLVEFFESFAAADAYQEVRDVMNYMRSDDVLTTYLYFGAIKFGTSDFPLFYLPVTVANEEGGSAYNLTADPTLYIHKQAIEFIVSELKRDAQRVGVAVVPERIVHLDSEVTAHQRMVTTMRELTRSLDVIGGIDFEEARIQVSRSPQLRASNAVYLAVADRSDESLVNDYEALLSSLDADHQAAAGMFHGIVQAMLFEEPVSVSAEVRADWQAMDTSARLVTSSPIPLNEEQIRIDCARKKPNCRFIAVEGPPGTGKSHTITALAFNAIMEHLSVLVISDKNEALDVVQDKLEQALEKIRGVDDFPNPILRLGKDGTYRQLMSGSARGRIMSQHKAQEANMPSVESELSQETGRLSSRIEQTVTAMTQVELVEIAELNALEAQINALGLGAAGTGGQGWAEEMLAQGHRSQPALHAIGQACEAYLVLGALPTAEIQRTYSTEPSLDALLQRLRAASAAAALKSTLNKQQIDGLGLFRPMPAAMSAVLLKYIARIEELRRPIIGFAFQNAKLAALDAEIAQVLSCTNPVGICRKLPELKAAVSGLSQLASVSESAGIPETQTSDLYALVMDKKAIPPGVQAAFQLVWALQLVAKDICIGKARASPHAGAEGSMEIAVLLARYLTLEDRLQKRFASVPEVDFVGEKGRLEALNTVRLAHRLDSRFLKFAEENRATAAALGGVIRQRSQFPTEQFKTLRDAFPCVIAGIRELGQFVPLKTQVFDLLIIDEGSQVSVAQAIPAMLRAKQVIVFGDRRQFSNVKSHNASNAINAGYVTELQSYMRDNISAAVDKIERLQRFDVKRSVLEFMGLLANHTEMLRKHFRGYPELISYSSKNFYDGQLQAIKIRPVPIEEVLKFEVLEHDGRSEQKPNTNSLEAKRLMELLESLLEGPASPSVGIITPHREQAVLIGSMVMRHPKGERFERELRLKIMTFDSCQGEERDIIIYSMVATRQRDVLNYVFPVEIVAGGEDAEESMKAQRLNVGFSRAKECMIFVLSKPPEEFRGTIAKALLHYQRVLNERVMAEDIDTDAASPMEKKVLGWLKATSFMQTQVERVELIAQFPVGDYLRQLDSGYKHPAYRADFLLRHFGEETTSNVIIEYDGFTEHFTDRDRVNAGNYERYYRPEDVERQFVLESYGYRFLRINRFNLGADPIATLDARLRSMITAEASTDVQAVGRIKQQAQSLDHGESKVCGRCKTIKALTDFFDESLASGAGGHGRVCMTCKTPTRPEPTTPASEGYGNNRRRSRSHRY